MRRVFVSYSRNNLDIVTQLIQDLQAVGVNTWHDQTLTGGQRWWDNILSEIRDCEIFVFALSPESWKSEACRSELKYVTQLKKPILPVLVSDGINLNLLSAPLNEIQVTDYRKRDKGATLALFKSINTTPPGPALPDPLPAPPPVPISYYSNLKDQIESPEPLTSQQQITLIFELEQGVNDGRSPTEVRELLLSLKRRDDLLAKIDMKIDAALQSLQDKPPVKPVPPVVSGPIAPPYQPHGAGDYRPHANSGLCPKCSAQLAAEARFCGGCGSAVGGSGGLVQGPGGHTPTPSGAKRRTYMCAANDTGRLIADIKVWLDEEGFDTQQMNAENQGLLLQIKKRGGWRDFVGMATSLNIVFHQSADALTVEIGAGKWIDKAAVGTVSLFILWPLAVTAGIGAWEQMKMPEKIFDFIGARLAYR
jgi:hypothetical protein